jgi:hypothetical protein
MNKLYRLPLRIGSKTQVSDARRRRKSPNLVVIGILAVGALFALTAIGLTVFGAFKHKASLPQEVGVATPPPAAEASPRAPENKEGAAVAPLLSPDPAPSAPLVTSNPATDPKTSGQEPAATPARSSTPAVSPVSVGQKHEHKPEAETKSQDKSLTKAARQTLEKKRMEAERKRAQLEEKYQNHEISTDAYNKGEQEYKTEIQKYRNQLKSGGE